MKILFLSSWYPYPADNGSKIRLFNLLRGLATRHEVSLISFVDRPRPDVPPELSAICRRVHTVPRRNYDPASGRALLGLLRMAPRSVYDTYQPEMARLLEEMQDQEAFDLIIASQWWTAAYAAHFGRTPAIYEEVEVGVFDSKVAQAAGPAGRLRHRLTLFKLQRYLRHQLAQFRACTVVSELEKARLAEMAPDYRPVHILPNCLDMADFREPGPAPRQDRLVFAGSMTYFANYQGMSWFAEQVWPLIRERAQGVQVDVLGDPGETPLTAGEGLTMRGLVPDVRPYVASAWVSLAPIHLGGGTRLKILEALALGTPVVTTSKGVEGLEAAHEQHLLVADSPVDFAAAVLRLLNDHDLRQRLSEAGRRLVRERYDWQAVLPTFLDLVEKAAAR